MKTIKYIILIVVIFGILSCESRTGVKDEDILKSVVTIEARNTGEPISRYIYGQFIEHLGRCIYGGIWAEMLEDRKFFYPITDDYKPWTTVTDQGWSPGGDYPVLTGSPWKVIGGKGAVRMVTDNSFVGEVTPEVLLPGDGNPVGIEQGELGLIEGKEYIGRAVLSGDPLVAPIRVSLIWGEGEKDRFFVEIGGIGSDFVKFPFRFRAGATTNHGRLEIVGVGKGTFRIGTVSLMPADNIRGWRADTIKLLKELNSPVYRWPGGNFVSGYDWKDGIGDRDRRPPRKNPAWTGIEHNDVGIHEYIDLCRELNAEPFIAVNTGLGSVKEAAEEVEYTNGNLDTPMGKWRAENGHADPFNVKWWAVGNEMYGDWQLGHMPLEEYVKKHNRVATAMRAVDPSVKLIGVGVVGDWSKAMMTYCSDFMELLSEHIYYNEKKEVAEHVAQMPQAIKRVAEAHRKYRENINGLAEKDIRIAMDEWNYWYGDYIYGELGVRYFLKDALGITAGLHEFIRNSDIYFMANYAQTVNVIGCIKTNKTSAAFATTGLPLKLYREEFGVIPVEIRGVPEPLDMVAAWTKDRNAITVAIVNPTEDEHEITITLKNAKFSGSGHVWIIEHDDPMVYNEPGKDPVVVIKDHRISGGSKRLTAGPFSINLFRLPVG